MLLNDLSYFGALPDSQKTEEQKKQLDEIETTLKKHIVGSGCLALALNLSLQRYMPHRFGGLSLARVTGDLALV